MTEIMVDYVIPKGDPFIIEDINLPLEEKLYVKASFLIYIKHQHTSNWSYHFVYAIINF